MHATTAAPAYFEDVWSDVPRAFRQTHPVPPAGDRAGFAAWGSAVAKDSAAAAKAILAAAEAEVKYRGDLEAADATAAHALPFGRLAAYLAMIGPLDRPCDECGAEPGEPCRPACTSTASTLTTN